MKMIRGIPFTTLLFIAGSANAAFNLLTDFDSSVRTAFGISTKCLAAINSTIACDEATAKLASIGMDENYWYKENITTLCTSQCQSSMTSWLDLVEKDCAQDTVTQAGVVVKAKSIPLQYTHALDLACLQDKSKNWCFIDSQTWVGSQYVRYHEDLCLVDDPPAICDDPDFDVEAIDPSLQSVIGLYDQSLYCNECFLRIWRQRLLSPFLVKGNWTEYRIGAFEELQKKCAVSMPYTTTDYSLFVGTQTAAPVSTSPPTCSFDISKGEYVCPTSASTSGPAPTCTGQVVEPPTRNPGCSALAEQYGVATGDLRVAAGNDLCKLNSTICLPLPCETRAIAQYGESCSSLARELSNQTNEITREQFIGWNPNIVGSCDFLALGQRICVSPPGGHWIANSTIKSPPSGVATYYTTATPMWPTQSGSVENCGRYHEVVDGDTCNLVCLIYGITFSALRKFNTYLNTDCTNLWLKSSVCIGEVTYQQPVSTDGRCGVDNGNATCTGSGFGSCCNTYGWCGDSNEYCALDTCVSGACTGSPTSTKDGSCGPNFGGSTCDNPRFGPCCSLYGYCGEGPNYCAVGNW